MSDSLKNVYENGFGPGQRLRPPTANERAQAREAKVLERIAAARADERAKVLAELWDWLETMPETMDFQVLGEHLSAKQKETRK